MNQNKLSSAKLFYWCLAALCCLGFLLAFARVINHDWGFIFKKDLYQHDESVNSVVSANTTRKFFPSTVRTNPLTKQQGIWMEGPNWQHIPPLFAYVPTLLFKIDGQVSIEIKRLSYALVDLFTGLIFILGLAWLTKKPMVIIAAAIASILWILTPFTQRLITGNDFGTSDIVLSFTVILCFITAVYYLRPGIEERRSYSWGKLILLGAIFSLPLLAKNVLGGIPAATFVLLLLWDHRKINTKVLSALFGFLALLTAYYGALFISSPETFRAEIFVSFKHVKDFEGWARPWNYYISTYLPQNYLYHFWNLYLAGLLISLTAFFKKTLDRNSKILLSISLLWFLINLVAVSALTSKAPNFIYQSFLLSLFFIVFGIGLILSENRFAEFIKHKFSAYQTFINLGLVIICLPLLSYMGLVYNNLFHKINITRQAPYVYASEHEQFYGLAEYAQKTGISNKDIVILNAGPNDCWSRYYILFLTGAEAKTFDEVYSSATDTSTLKTIRENYDKLFFVSKTGSDLNIPGTISRTDYLNFNIFELFAKSLPETFFSELKKNIGSSKNPSIYSSNASCSWLKINPDLE